MGPVLLAPCQSSPLAVIESVLLAPYEADKPAPFRPLYFIFLRLSCPRGKARDANLGRFIPILVLNNYYSLPVNYYYARSLQLSGCQLIPFLLRALAEQMIGHAHRKNVFGFSNQAKLNILLDSITPFVRTDSRRRKYNRCD